MGSVRNAVLVSALAAVALASAAAASSAAPYRPRLVVATGQPVRVGETRFSLLTDFRGPATADIDLFVPAGFSPTLTQPSGAQIGRLAASVDDRGATPPYSGTVIVAPSGTVDAACDSAAHSAVWTATLRNATSSFSFTIFVRHLANPTAPSVPQPTELHWCLPKSAPRLSTLTFDLDGVFAQPARGSFVWDARLTPFDPATGAVVAGEQVSSLVLVRLPQVVRLAARSLTGHRYVVSGRVTEAGRPVRGPVVVWRSVGTGPFDMRHGVLTHSDSTGRFTLSERLTVRRPVRFKAHATAGFRDLSQPTCGTDANGVPCVSKSLAVWEQDSDVVTVAP